MKATKKVRFEKQVLVQHMTVAEQGCDSHFDSNFNQECHEVEEDAAAINDNFSTELPYMSVLPTSSTVFINSLNFTNRSRWIMSNSNINDIPPVLPVGLPYFSVLPTSSTAFVNSLNFINRSRWIMSNTNMNDIPPLIPFRQNRNPANTILNSALSILEWPQDIISPGIEYTVKQARAA